VRTHGPRGDDVVEPYHDRVRETILARLPRNAIIEGHGRLAAALEARGLGAERPDLLAVHLAEADRPVEAALWTERAGDQAAHALAFDRAAELYKRALGLTAHPPARAVTLYARLGDTLTNAGRGAAAAEAYLAGAALVDGDAALELRNRAAEQLLRSGHMDEGLGVVDGVLREVGLPTASRRWSPIGSLVIQRARLRVRRWLGPAPCAGSDDARRQLQCCWSAVVGLTMASPLRMAEYQARHLRLALAAHEPRRIAFGMAFEAVAAALAGPPASRADALLDEAKQWTARVGDTLAYAYVELAEGTIAFLRGRWRDALARCDAAARMFGEGCVGVAWEIGCANHLSLCCLMHMGRITQLRPRLTRALDEADRRGDRFTAAELRTALQPLVCLMDDRERDARAELTRVAADLPRRETTLLHWQHMQSSALVELYAGAPARAVAVIDQRLPAIRRAFLLRVYTVRGFTAYARMTAWLGALAAGAPAPARLRASIERACMALGTHLVARPVPRLIHAGLAVLRGDLPAAIRDYRAAAAGFDAIDMTMTGSAARWRLGELVGGPEGRALIDQATAELAAEGVVRPDRVVAMLVPVPADARRA
jgi:tetratricopeptide (TPR) repeat protein